MVGELGQGSWTEKYEHDGCNVVGAECFEVLALLDGLDCLGHGDVDGRIASLMADVSEDPPERLCWLCACSWSELGVEFVGYFCALKYFV